MGFITKWIFNKVAESKPPEPHPVTIQELDKLAATYMFFDSLKNMHRALVAKRRHNEMMDELRRIGR